MKSLFHLPGGIAQLGEHLPCKQGVMSSNLIISTGRDPNVFLLKQGPQQLEELLVWQPRSGFRFEH